MFESGAQGNEIPFPKLLLRQAGPVFSVAYYCDEFSVIREEERCANISVQPISSAERGDGSRL